MPHRPHLIARLSLVELRYGHMIINLSSQIEGRVGSFIMWPNPLVKENGEDSDIGDLIDDSIQIGTEDYVQLGIKEKKNMYI